jgi:hypothetical protein
MNQMTVQETWALDGDEHSLIETMAMAARQMPTTLWKRLA